MYNRLKVSKCYKFNKVLIVFFSQPNKSLFALEKLYRKLKFLKFEYGKDGAGAIRAGEVAAPTLAK
jgi:hypothetical protein